MKLGMQGSNVKSLGLGNKNVGHAPKFSGAGWYEISCPTVGCSRKASPDPTKNNPIRCGVKAPSSCPECRQTLPKRGFV